MGVEPASYVRIERPPMSDAELLELVRGRLRRGFEPDTLPLQLEMELDIPAERTREAVALVQGELQRASSMRLRRRLGLGALACGSFAVIDLAFGGTRAGGLLLVALVVTMGAALISWVLSELLTGSD